RAGAVGEVSSVWRKALGGVRPRGSEQRVHLFQIAPSPPPAATVRHACPQRIGKSLCSKNRTCRRRWPGWPDLWGYRKLAPPNLTAGVVSINAAVFLPHHQTSAAETHR